MKKSINAGAFPSEMTFEDIFKEAKEYGFEAIELTVSSGNKSKHTFNHETTEETFAEVKSLKAKYGIDVQSVSSGLYWSSGAFASENPEKREEALKILRTQLRCASGIGAEAILVVTNIDNEIGLKRSFDNTIEVFRSMKDEIAASGVKVGIENVWNGFFSSPYDIKYVLDGIDDPNVGLYFDMGNVVEFADTDWWIDMIGKYIVKVHVKDFKRTKAYRSGGAFCDLLEGDLNWEKAMPLLAKYYDGPLTAEISQGDRSADEFYPELSSALDKIIEMAGGTAI